MNEQRNQSNEIFEMHTPSQRGIEEARRIVLAFDECANAIRNEIGHCQEMPMVMEKLGEACMYAKRATFRRKGNRA